MNTRRYVVTLISLAILPLLLFHFQNCAPAGKITSSDSADGTVQLVDNYNKSQIQFVAPENEIQDEAPTVDISGLCNHNHNGARLRWTVIAGKDAQGMASGPSSCESGNFAVKLDQLDQYPCGVDHLLVVETDWGASASTHFTRHCQPLASKPISVPQGSPYGTTCALEYSPVSAAAEQQCLQICYRDNQVIYSRALEVSQCSSLAAGLAGP